MADSYHERYEDEPTIPEDEREMPWDSLIRFADPEQEAARKAGIDFILRTFEKPIE